MDVPVGTVDTTFRIRPEGLVVRGILVSMQGSKEF